VVAWGNNGSGDLGNGSLTNESVPVAVCAIGQTSCTLTHDELIQVKAIAEGDTHSLAVVKGGRIDSWGSNFDGELGNGSFAAASLPTFAPIANGPSGAIGATAISVGGDHSCALVQGGKAYCWGENDNGELGTGTTNVTAGQDGIASPVAVAGLPFPVSTISAGGQHTCAVLTDGSVWCWGYNISSQLGNNSAISAPSPVQVSGW
jgi:alpha-tubulin suppressor-like RCC1 family protein